MELYVHYDEHEFVVDLEWVDADPESVREACMEEWDEVVGDDVPRPTEEAWYDRLRYSGDEFVQHFVHEGLIDFSELDDWVTNDFLPEGAKMAYLKNMGVESIRDAEEAYYGHFSSPEQFAIEYIDSVYGTPSIPDILATNINWDGIASDLLVDGFWEIDDYYFRNI